VADRNDEDLLDVAELAKHLGVNRRSIARMVSEGRLPPPVRYGGLPRWRWGILRDWARAMEALEQLQNRGHTGTTPTQSGTPKKTT
jgi:predicted DNA-binding transcriptional regulator AlpA